MILPLLTGGKAMSDGLDIQLKQIRFRPRSGSEDYHRQEQDSPSFFSRHLRQAEFLDEMQHFRDLFLSEACSARCRQSVLSYSGISATTLPNVAHDLQVCASVYQMPSIQPLNVRYRTNRGRISRARKSPSCAENERVEKALSSSRKRT